MSALTVAAMALPVFAETQPVQTSVSIGMSNYREEDVSRDAMLGGDADRYDIDVYQFRLLTPVGEKWSLELAASRENMSGASPWGTVEGPDGKPAVIMSGATISDMRTELSLTATQHDGANSTALTVTQSKEDDYRASALAVSGEWALGGNLTTVSAGLSYSRDSLQPTDAAAFGRVSNEKKRSRSASIGISQVIDPSSVVFAGLSVTDHAGYLSDPYKLRDVRPRDRLEWALAARYRLFLDDPDAALHVDYRAYRDDWGIDSHMVHTSWYQNIGSFFQLVPNVRYYAQSEADFYRLIDDFSLPQDVAQSSDFRLGAYGAFTLGLKGIIQFPSWSVTISADRYVAGSKYGLESGEDHPARLEFSLVSVTSEYRF